MHGCESLWDESGEVYFASVQGFLLNSLFLINTSNAHGFGIVHTFSQLLWRGFHAYFLRPSSLKKTHPVHTILPNGFVWTIRCNATIINSNTIFWPSNDECCCLKGSRHMYILCIVTRRFVNPTRD